MYAVMRGEKDVFEGPIVLALVGVAEDAETAHNFLVDLLKSWVYDALLIERKDVYPHEDRKEFKRACSDSAEILVNDAIARGLDRVQYEKWYSFNIRVENIKGVNRLLMITTGCSIATQFKGLTLEAVDLCKSKK